MVNGALKYKGEGSSPHTRGALECIGVAASNRGIIPAYAGSTDDTGYFHVTLRDHPRIRGEHFDYDPTINFAWGSSPHTRGAQLVCLIAWRIHGIIPAYAGSTMASNATTAGRKDHPRIRGEHRVGEVTESEEVGSSPHTRGARGRYPQDLPQLGIIPAYAGSTTRRRVSRPRVFHTLASGPDTNKPQKETPPGGKLLEAFLRHMTS